MAMPRIVVHCAAIRDASSDRQHRDMTAPRAVHDRAVSIRFVLGSLISVVTVSATMLGHVLGPAALLLPSLGFFVGGAVAGTALRRSIGAAFGFGLAFVIGNVAGMASVIATQGMTGRERLLFGYALGYSIVFAIAGWIGLSGAAMPGRPRVIGVVGFSAGGCAAAILLVVLLKVQLIGGSPLRAVMGFAIPMTLPWVIGGVVLDEALRRTANKRRTTPVTFTTDC
jgi:hypothetical protein